jgi:hypothetical protein
MTDNLIKWTKINSNIKMNKLNINEPSLNFKDTNIRKIIN